MDGSFSAVAAAIAAHLATAPPASNDVGDALRRLRRAAVTARPRQGYRPAPLPRDYRSVLAPAIVAGCADGVGGVAHALASLPDELPWSYSYPARADAADLADRIAFAELIGPDGPLSAPDCRVGFTLIAHSTFYPFHRHPAVELYLVIAGKAQWMTPDREQVVPPGGFVLHRVNQPHAMRTSDETLLALYAWHGDIDAPSVYI